MKPATPRFVPIIFAMTAAMVLSIGSAHAVIKQPDLIVASTSNPSTARLPGRSFTETIKIRNRGSATARSSYARVFLSSNSKKDASDVRIGSVRVGRIAPGRSKTIRPTATIPASAAAQQWYVISCADATRLVRESNERNQCRTSATKVTVVLAPGTPTSLITSPVGIGGDPTPEVSGSATNASQAQIFNVTSAADCTGSIVGLATIDGEGDFSVEVDTAQSDGVATQYAAKAINVHNHSSVCSSATAAYTFDQDIPNVPVLSSVPISPADENSPHIHTGADSTVGTTIALFNNIDCSGSPIAGKETLVPDGTGDIDTTVAVIDDTSNLYSAIATRNAIDSACSEPFEYVEDSTAPSEPTIVSSAPVAPGNTLTPTISGTGGSPLGTVTLYKSGGLNDCNTMAGTGSVALDGTWSAQVNAAVLVEGFESAFFASTTDEAGNESACSIAGFSYVKPIDVSISNFSFAPSSLGALSSGVTVRFTVVAGTHSLVFTTNPGSVPNSPSPISTPYVVTFTTTGAYAWKCGFHPSMVGSVTIT